MLILFDIDGTLLIKASTEHAQGVLAAIREVWDIEIGDLPPMRAAGRTDLDIAREILLSAGVGNAAFDARSDAFQAASLRHCELTIPADLSERRAPGALDVVTALGADPAHRLSLVTGNLEPIARIKLASAGLGAWFAPGQGGFGSDAEDRDALPPIARQRAGEAWNGGERWERSQTVVVGDTPRDIACARADGVHVVAVPTGPYGTDELADADAVIASLHELPAALATLPR